MFQPKFKYIIVWPRADASSLPLAVKALIDCPHDHWFLVRQGENVLQFSDSGLVCLKNAGIPDIEHAMEDIRE